MMRELALVREAGAHGDLRQGQVRLSLQELPGPLDAAGASPVLARYESMDKALGIPPAMPKAAAALLKSGRDLVSSYLSHGWHDNMKRLLEGAVKQAQGFSPYGPMVMPGLMPRQRRLMAGVGGMPAGGMLYGGMGMGGGIPAYAGASPPACRPAPRTWIPGARAS